MKCSDRFGVERGIKQGSVLSPVLFLIVMDPLLKHLQESSLGLSVNIIFMLVGSYMLMTSGLWPHPMFLWRDRLLS